MNENDPQPASVDLDPQDEPTPVHVDETMPEPPQVEGMEDSAEPIESDGAVVQPRVVVKRAGMETDEVFPFMCPATIGRFDPSVGPIDVDLGNIEEGTYVSRKHAKIINEDGVYKIVDLGSSNGTYIARDGDFQKVDEAEINSGDEIALGNARLVFYV